MISLLSTIYDAKEFSNAKIDTLKNLSYDIANNYYLVNSRVTAIDFDNVKDIYYVGKKSNDALYISSNTESVFIEFKNKRLNEYFSDYRRKNTNELIQKNSDSIEILLDIISKDYEFLKENVSYIFVYNKKKLPHDTYKERFSSSFSVGVNLKKRLGLDLFDKKLKEVQVLNDVEFNEIFK